MKKFSTIVLFLLLFINAKLNVFSKTLLKFPYNNTTIIDKSITIEWTKNNICPTYTIEISRTTDFGNKILSVQTNNTNYAYTFPNFGKFYVRIKPICVSEWSIASIEIINLNDEKNNIENWFSADTNVSITTDRVSRWGDRIDNINKYAQNPTIANRPLFINQEPLINNNPAFYFKPENVISFLDLNKQGGIVNPTFILLYNIDLENNSTVQHLIAETGANGYFAQNNTNSGFGLVNQNGGIIINSDVSVVSPNYSIYSATKNNLYVNNTKIKSTKLTNITNPIIYKRFGSRPGNDAVNFKGKVAEILVFNKELNDNEISTWNNYLFTKYAPPVNLGGDTIIGNSFSENIILNASNRFVKYLWTTGDTTSTVNVKTSGTYGVWATDVFGHTSYSEKKVYPYNRLDNDSVYICESGTFTIDLKTNPLLFSVKWLDNNSSNTIRTFNQPGKYIVEIKDQAGKAVLDTINILTEKITFNKDFIGNTTRLCKGDTLEIRANTEISTVLWSNGSNSYKYPASSNEQISIVAQSFIGCSYNSNINIEILGQKPKADFEISTILCEQQEIKFTDKSSPYDTSKITQWQWNLDENKTSNEQSPTIIYNSLGFKTITLKAITNVGCSTEIKKQIKINQKPRVFFDNLLACQNKLVQFRDLSTPNADSMAMWQWDFNQLGSSNKKNPLFAFPDNQIYSVQLKATNNRGCYDTITKILGVNPSPVSNFIADSIGCIGTPLSFTNNSTIAYPINISKFSWDFGDGIQDNILNTTTHQYNSSGTYTISLATQATNQCVDTIKKQINIYKNPIANFEISNNHCVGKSISFYDSTKTVDSTILTKWNWSFGKIGNSINQNPSFTFNEQGNYAVQLIAETNKGCKSTKTKSVTIANSPNVDFSFNPAFGTPPLKVDFRNLSPGGTELVWNFGDGSPNSSDTTPTHTFNNIGSYSITLSASNALGCTSSISKNILVDFPKFDASILDINLLKNDNKYTVLAGIENKGNVSIQNMIITARLENGTMIRENWNGNLSPGQVLNYTFSNKLIFDEAKDIPVACVNIESVNNTEDLNLENNTVCKEIKIGKLNLLTAYPNPTKDIVKVGIMFPSEMNYTLIVYNDLAQFISSKNLTSKAGYNLIDIDLSNLNSAIYTVEIRTENNIFRKRVWKQ